MTGVDRRPQPFYPFPFHLADALSFPLDGFDVVHASPPCQRYSRGTPERTRHRHPDLIEAVRERLVAWGGPWVIENVEGSPLDRPVWLCGSAFGLGVWRHRGFESNVPLAGTGCCHLPDPLHVYGTGLPEGTAAARAAMGIGWLPFDSLKEAVPPAFTAFLGRQLRAYVAATCGIRSQDVGDSSPELTACVTAAPVLRSLCRCGRGLPLPAKTGRWPLHCSPACRQAAWRERRLRGA